MEIDCRALFHQLHPGFFAQETIRRLPPDQVYAEMILDLRGPAPWGLDLDCPQGIRFGLYEGDLPSLHAAVRLVEEDWVQYFQADSRAFCAWDGDSIAGFCLLDAMGTYQGLRVGGPGCVGTVPAFRRRGIGLAMVARATERLQREGFALSYIHYTHLDAWYARLGYQTVLRWNSGGVLWAEGHRGLRAPGPAPGS